jgi:hypothetical protein
MKLALVGLSQSGKTRVFGALSGRDMSCVSFTREPAVAIVKVEDERLDFLNDICKPPKKVQADFELVDFGPAPRRNETQAESKAMNESELLGALRLVDGFLVVLRGFECASSQPALGRVDPAAEWEELRGTFLLADAAQVERKLERMQKVVKRGIKAHSPEELEYGVLCRLKAHLGEMKPLDALSFNDEEKKIISSYHFLSLKPLLILLNAGEGDLSRPVPAEAELSKHHRLAKISAQVEMELSQLPAGDRECFMKELGVAALMRDRVVRAAYEALGLIVFFTIGDDEVRAWSVARGANAVEAAGRIHTDFAKGFIRAEVVSYGDFYAAPSYKDLRAKGRTRLEGKEYVVQDGDIIEFRFNV